MPYLIFTFDVVYLVSSVLLLVAFFALYKYYHRQADLWLFLSFLMRVIMKYLFTMSRYVTDFFELFASVQTVFLLLYRLLLTIVYYKIITLLADLKTNRKDHIILSSCFFAICLIKFVSKQNLPMDMLFCFLFIWAAVRLFPLCGKNRHTTVLF